MRLLDLFCGAGGAAVGYHGAGFEIVGVDIARQPNYPYEFTQRDVLDLPPAFLTQFDLIHASPPCQAYSVALRHMALSESKLVETIRFLLAESGVPYVIENVIGAPLATQPTLAGVNGVVLCGTSFGLKVRRHRIFETSFPVAQPECGDHSRTINPYNSESRKRDGIQFGRRQAFGEAMGIDWMTNEHEISEAIPPAYTRYLGEQFLAQIKVEP